MLAHSATTTWSFEPLQLVPVAIGALLYWKRARTLSRRGTPVAGWRYFLFSLGIALVVVALVSPIATLGEDLATKTRAIPGNRFFGIWRRQVDAIEDGTKCLRRSRQRQCEERRCERS